MVAKPTRAALAVFTTPAGAMAASGTRPMPISTRPWGNVLGSLQKRFEAGPVDWSAWLAQLKGMSAAPAPAASR